MQRMYNTVLPVRVATGSDETAKPGSARGIDQLQLKVQESPVEQRPVIVIDQRTLSREGMVQLLESSDKFRIVAVELLQVQGETSFREGVILLSLGSTEITDDQVRSDIAALSRTFPDVPIIVVCDSEDSLQVGEALRQGVRGYIPTTLTARVVVEAVRLVQAGGTFVPAGAFADALTQRRIERPDPVPAVVLNLSGLTPRQREVFDLLRRGKPNKIIAHELSMCESTVKVHVRQIMRKLHASNRTQAAFLAARAVEQDA